MLVDLSKKNKIACACSLGRKKAQTLWDDTILSLSFLFIRLFWIYLNGKIVVHADAFIMNKEKINAKIKKKKKKKRVIEPL